MLDELFLAQSTDDDTLTIADAHEGFDAAGKNVGAAFRIGCQCVEVNIGIEGDEVLIALDLHMGGNGNFDSVFFPNVGVERGPALGKCLLNAGID